MNEKNRFKWGLAGFLFAIIFFFMFASIFGSDPLTFIKDNFVIETVIEPYFKLLCILLASIILLFSVCKRKKVNRY
ncbi:hypothetical protein [Clostridium lundense]|uniref:hypothetical protein n=1 Tax=Clostridium lundense TaxID=319475 RepID=UPI000480609E|nr:hypothetical protein [Clostridium lundense]